jgi:hypothetical protein
MFGGKSVAKVIYFYQKQTMPLPICELIADK